METLMLDVSAEGRVACLVVFVLSMETEQRMGERRFWFDDCYVSRSGNIQCATVRNVPLQ